MVGCMIPRSSGLNVNIGDRSAVTCQRVSGCGGPAAAGDRAMLAATIVKNRRGCDPEFR